MAIEFNCPFCKALIRVPDNAGGGKGKCPKCATRLSVPKVSTSKAAAPLLIAPPPMREPVQPDPPRVDPPREIENFFDPEYDPRKVAALGPADIDEAPQSLPGEFPDDFADESPVLSSRTAIRPKVSLAKKLGRGLWLVPVAFGLILAGGFGWYVWQEYQSDLAGGELTAETADELELPPALIEKSSIKQPSDDVQTVLVDLEKSPVPLLSSLMQVQLRGSSRGVLVSLKVGQSARFFRVDVAGDKPLAKYLTQHAADFEQSRMKAIEQGATAFAIQYRKVIAKKADQSSLTDFRNTLGLPALVRGPGHHIVATHGRTIYPCVYEDHEGALYFLLPPDAKEFEISGRKDDDGTVVFPARYKVKVAGQIKVYTKRDAEAAGKSKDQKTKDKKGPVVKPNDEPEEKMDSKDDAATKKGE
ncbi:MAG: hypothetical protein AABP62_18180 [Planctomycetota bacterium]